MLKKILSISLFVLFAFIIVKKVQAGTNLTVTCDNEGPCDVSPAATPLFYETNLVPRDNRYQTMTITNNDTNDTCDLVLAATDTTVGQAVNLAEQIYTAIHASGTDYYGTSGGGQALADRTFQNLYDEPNPISLGSLSPGATRVYTWYATLADFGNEYQNTETVFDYEVTISCAGGVTPTPDDDDDDDDDGGGGGDGGKPWKCEDPAPSACSNLRITHVGTNTVSLTWSPSTPVTHYAIVFTRKSDGAKYGSPNIGNVTSYTVTNLSGGANYSFEIIPFNGCMGGPRCGVVETGVVPGPYLSGRPRGEDGQVLGATDELTPTPSPSLTPEPTGEPKVAGVTTGCDPWRFYIPWILLIAQLFFILASEYYFKKDDSYTKHYLAVGITIASIVIFYLIRECQCYFERSWLAWLCQWYWIVAILLTVIVKLFSYAFIEEIKTDKNKADNNQVTKKD